MSPEEADLLAGEYVLGTLDPLEREAFTRALARDAALRQVVSAWERRFAPLSTAARPVMPAQTVWLGIERALFGAAAAPPQGMPAPAPPRPAPTPPVQAAKGQAAAGRARPAPSPSPEILEVPEVDRLRRIADETRRMRRSLSRWRLATAAFASIAAGLAAAVALQRLLPPKPADAYLAVVNQGGNQPALVVRVDLTANRVSVRPVNMAVPPGRSLELWVIGQNGVPHSLGLVGAQPLTLPTPTVFPQGVEPQAAAFAVTSEPPGGSPTGGPSGPVLYSGPLVKE